MQKFAAWIVKHKGFVGALMLALLVFSVFSQGWGDVESDVTKYLPKQSETRIAMNIMEQEFITYASEQVMVAPVDDAEEGYAIQAALQEIDGVLQAEFDTSYSHYRGERAIYYLTFSGVDGDPSVTRAMKEVEECVSGYTTWIYNASLSDVSNEVASEMIGVAVIIVLVVLGVLLFTSDTFTEVLVLLLTFGSAALLNMGTNFLLGTISMISSSVSTVMQLALSIDYAIILCNRYKEEHEHLPIPQAVESALAKAVPEILSSSLTTVAGLLSMTLMQFTLGRDMGFCLVKAVLLSLLSVFTFMPVLLLVFGRSMDKTRHKSFLPRVDFLGKFAYKTRRIVPVFLVAAAIFAAISFRDVRYAYDGSLIHTPHQSATAIAVNEINKTFGSNNMVAMIVPAGDYDRENAMIREIEECEEVKSVLGLANVEVQEGYTLTTPVTYDEFMSVAQVDETIAQALFAYYAADHDDYASATGDIRSVKAPILDLFLTIQEMSDSGLVELTNEQASLIDSLRDQLKMAQDQLQGVNYSRILVYLTLPTQSEETFAFLDTLHVLSEEYYDEVYLAGNSVSVRDFDGTFQTDSTVVSVLSIVMVMLILLLTFKSAAMPVILILIIQSSIWINFAIPVWKGEYVYFMSYIIVSAIQMGANIDYAIVVSSRYNDLRQQGMDQRSAMIDTMNLAFPTIITSGVIMAVAGLLIGYRVSYEAVACMGTHLGIGTLIAMVVVSFALPQVLLFTDGIVRRTMLRVNRGRSLRRRKVLVSVAMVLAIAATILFVPAASIQAGSINTTTIPRYEDLIARTEELRALAQEVSEEEREYDEIKFDFAEYLTTENIGAEKLAEGEKEYAEGQDTLKGYKEMLADGEGQYADGVYMYEQGLAAYQEGLATFQAGQAEYDAGVARMRDGQAQYDAGLALFNQKQAEYNAGEAQLATAKQQYAAAEKQLNAATPAYNTLYSLYNSYLSAKERYEQAISSGDLITAVTLRGEMTTAQSILRTQELVTGMSAEEAIAEYQSGQQQLADASVQIADAEQQLADARIQLADGQAQLDAAKAELDAGQAQLNAAKAELDAGQNKLDDAQQQLAQAEYELANARNELADGKQQIKDGEEQLTDARKQLEEGRETLEKNQEQLQNSMAALDQYAAKEDRLNAGIELLLAADGVADLALNSSNPERVCSAALNFFRDKITELDTASRWAGRLTIGCGVMMLLAVIALVLGLFGKNRAAKWLAFCSAVAALVVLLLWRNYCGYFGKTVPYALAAALVVDLLFAIVHGSIQKEKQNTNIAY